MKYIVFAFNYPTLCRALRYIDEAWGKQNTLIIYVSMVAELPRFIECEYNVKHIRGNICRKHGGVLGIMANIFISHRSWHVLKKVADRLEEFIFVVFRDNEMQEATLIENAKKRYQERMHIWLIEEGTGLYATKRAAIDKIEIKRLVYKMMKISDYALTTHPQGMHDAIEKVICLHPEAIAEKYKENSIAIEKQIDVFVPNFNKKFAEYVLGKCTEQQKYDYVFLTMPISDLTQQEFAGSYQEYDKFLKKFIALACEYGTLLIKSHPRDSYDYSKYIVNERVKVCSATENSIPYECLAEYYGHPRMITFSSSACINGLGRKSSIYVSKLLEKSNFGDKFTKEYYIENNIEMCQSFEELRMMLSDQL